MGRVNDALAVLLTALDETADAPSTKGALIAAIADAVGNGGSGGAGGGVIVVPYEDEDESMTTRLGLTVGEIIEHLRAGTILVFDRATSLTDWCGVWFISYVNVLNRGGAKSYQTEIGGRVFSADSLTGHFEGNFGD